MEIVNIYYAKTHFSQLLEKVSQGEEVIIGKAGKPIARLLPYYPTTSARKPGACKGKIKIAKDFDELPAAFMQHFQEEQKK